MKSYYLKLRIFAAFLVLLVPLSQACELSSSNYILSIVILIAVIIAALWMASSELKRMQDRAAELVRAGVFIGSDIGIKIANGKEKSNIVTAYVTVNRALDEVTVVHDGRLRSMNLSVMQLYERELEEDETLW